MPTGARKGLQQALARSGSSVIAIAEMQTSDLLAGMTDDQKTALAAELAPKSAGDAKPENNGMDSTEGASAADEEAKPDDEDEDEEGDGATAPSGERAAQASARIKAVAKAVVENDNCKGKASLALAMLADDDFASLSANGIIKALGQSPAPGSHAGDSEATARAEMKAAIAETQNSNIEAGNQGQPDTKAKADAVWNRAYGIKEGAN